MRKKIGRPLLCLVLVLSLTTGVLAADPSAMQDISGHWAYDSISACMENAYFEGVSDDEFAPDEGMTRGMFVTVLGRIAGIDPEDYQDWYLDNLYSDVSSERYDAPYINWATRFGIACGVGGGQFAPDDPITREQMAAILIRYASICNYCIVSTEASQVEEFSDADEISDFACDSVETLRMTGIFEGVDNGDGTCAFLPQKAATRAEAAAVFCRFCGALEEYDGRELVEPESISVLPDSLELDAGVRTNLISRIVPEATSIRTVTWVSSDPLVAQVDLDGRVTGISAGTATIYAYTWNGLCSSMTVTVYENNLAYDGESYADKCLRVFGEVVSEPRTYYLDADPNDYLETIAVRVWDFTDSTYTEKTTKIIWLDVNKSLVPTVRAIFEEIYSGEEQFPIYSAGGYYYGNMSEHTSGLAIDINPDSNYYCDSSGNAITGSHWDPENDPYSIPLEGDVVNAFRKYGFTRGIYWSSGYKDYMHFSYFAT